MNSKFPLIVFATLAVSGINNSERFKIDEDPAAMQTPILQLGVNRIPSMALEVSVDRRQPLKYGPPGDYFRSPFIPDTVEIAISEINEIRDLLAQNIKAELFDSLVLANIVGYQYQFKRYGEERREYFVRYAKADTVLVISGWFGKLFSFYVALPGWTTCDENHLQAKISALTNANIELRKIPDKRQISDPYFIEYIDRANMVRVRNYHIRELIETLDVTQPEYRDRTLIEITRFLDKEAMP